MAPFDAALNTKISPLIDGQVPDFIQADHPEFVNFLHSFHKINTIMGDYVNFSDFVS